MKKNDYWRIFDAMDQKYRQKQGQIVFKRAFFLFLTKKMVLKINLSLFLRCF